MKIGNLKFSSLPALITVKTNGKILVSEGKSISSGALLAEEEFIPQIISFNLSRFLLVSPKICPKHMLKKSGQAVKKNETIASKKSLLGIKKRIVKAPCNGLIEAYHEETGEMLISLPKEKKQILSPVTGIVKKTGKGQISIEVEGEEYLLKEAFGRNFSVGQLEVLIASDSGLFSFDVNMAGKILVSRCWSNEAIEKAIAMQISAIITLSTDNIDLGKLSAPKKFLVGDKEEKISLTFGVLKDESDFKKISKKKNTTGLLSIKDKKLILLNL